MTRDPCPICLEPVERRPGERPSCWLKRKTCSERCKQELSSLSRTRDPAKRGAHPECPICHGPVDRRPRERRTPWMNRQTCSAACLRTIRTRVVTETNTAFQARRRAATIADYIHPPCPACHGPVEIRDDEIVTAWRNRKTCSDACWAVWRREPRKHKSPARGAPVERPSSARKPRRLKWDTRKQRPAPPTFETVDEALARGLKVKLYPPAYAAPVTGAGL